MCRPYADIVVEIHWIDWAQAQGALEIYDRLLRLISIILEPSEPAPGPCRIRIECNGTLDQHARGSMVPHEDMHCAEY